MMWLIGFLLLGIHLSPCDTFNVIGSPVPVTARVGSEVVLPCLVIPAKIPEDMILRWYRTDWNNLVHQYLASDAQDHNEKQLDEFQGRTRIFESQLASGNVSLRLLDLRLTDSGSYVCFVGSKNYDEQTNMELQVAGLGLQPVIHVMGFRNRQIQLECKSSHWYPEPKLTWVEDDSRNVTGTREVSTDQASGLMSVHSSIEVSRGHKNRYTCRLYNSLLGVGRQASVQIDGIFYPTFTTRLLTFCVFLLLLLVAMAGCLAWVIREDSEIKELKNRPLREDYNVLKAEKAQIDHELAYERKLSTTEPLRYLRHAVNLTLDAVSLNPWLIVSNDMTSVRGSDIQQGRADNALSFDTEPFVLGSVGFSSGQHYWEVEVEDKTSWDLGVARESVTRKGDITLNPSNGYWSIGRFWGGFEANAESSVRIEVKSRPRKIGVFLQYQEGKISFYDAELMVHFYTFEDKFTGKLYPFLCPWWSRENITLTPVER